jgi:DNA-binding CsgD family transcriptional regulator
MAGSPSGLTCPPPALTARAVELLRCLATGASTAQIAGALSVSSNTVRTRVRRLEAKLGVSTRRQLMEAARGRDLR